MTPSDADAASDRSPEGDAPPRWRSPLAVGIGLHLAVWVPAVVGLIAFNRPSWHPIADLAQTELRVRDVGTSHTPLVGLAGRIGPWYDPGSHPGPLSFWALAPVYRMLGSSPFALSAASTVLHAGAHAAALALALRRGGVHLMVAIGAAVAVAVHAYGIVVFAEPWNPYMPVLWWLVVVLAVWSVLDGDRWMLVVAVAAGSFCAQTHLPYLGLVGGLGAVAVGGLGLAWWSARSDPARERIWPVIAVAAAVGLALWAAPLIDQVDGVGNLSRVRDSMLHPEGEPVGLVTGAQQVVERYGLGQWTHRLDVNAPPAAASGWNASGVVVLAAWAVAAALSWVRGVGPDALRRLHIVLGSGLLLGVYASSRIHGELWFYLYLWAGILSLVTLVAIGWTVGAAWQTRAEPGPAGGATSPSPGSRSRITPGITGVAVPVAVLVLAVGGLVADVPSAEPSRPDLSAVLGAASADTVAALESRDDGDDARYLVQWVDPVSIGSLGIGMVAELERAGFDVGVDRGHRVGATPHRVVEVDDATAVVEVLVGDAAIAAGRERPDDVSTEVAHVDPRSDADRAEVAEVSAEIDERLREQGFDDRVATWRATVFTEALDPSLPADVRERLLHLLDLGAPVSVFVVDPSAA